jgi:hypothetical protein
MLRTGWACAAPGASQLSPEQQLPEWPGARMEALKRAAATTVLRRREHIAGPLEMPASTEKSKSLMIIEAIQSGVLRWIKAHAGSASDIAAWR